MSGQQGNTDGINAAVSDAVRSVCRILAKLIRKTMMMDCAGGKSGPGCVVWESGLALAEFLSQHHEKGKCGCLAPVS